MNEDMNGLQYVRETRTFLKDEFLIEFCIQSKLDRLWCSDTVNMNFHSWPNCCCNMLDPLIVIVTKVPLSRCVLVWSARLRNSHDDSFFVKTFSLQQYSGNSDCPICFLLNNWQWLVDIYCQWSRNNRNVAKSHHLCNIGCLSCYSCFHEYGYNRGTRFHQRGRTGSDR